MNNEQLNSNGNRRGMNANSRANLKPSNGKSGRPPSILSITSLLKAELLRIPTVEEDGFDGKGKTNAEWVARKAVIMARNGEIKALQEILDRTEGKVTQSISGEGGGPIAIVFQDMNKETQKLIEELSDGSPALTEGEKGGSKQ